MSQSRSHGQTASLLGPTATHAAAVEPACAATSTDAPPWRVMVAPMTPGVRRESNTGTTVQHEQSPNRAVDKDNRRATVSASPAAAAAAAEPATSGNEQQQQKQKQQQMNQQHFQQAIPQICQAAAKARCPLTPLPQHNPVAVGAAASSNGTTAAAAAGARSAAAGPGPAAGGGRSSSASPRPAAEAAVNDDLYISHPPGWKPELGQASTAAATRARSAAVACQQSLQQQGKQAFVKGMSNSQVSGGFWMAVLIDMRAACGEVEKDVTLHCYDRAGMGRHDMQHSLPGSSSQWRTIYKSRCNKDGTFRDSGPGLSGGWRGFAIDQRLYPNDTVVFEMLDSINMRVHIFRAHRQQTEVPQATAAASARAAASFQQQQQGVSAPATPALQPATTAAAAAAAASSPGYHIRGKRSLFAAPAPAAAAAAAANGFTTPKAKRRCNRPPTRLTHGVDARDGLAIQAAAVATTAVAAAAARQAPAVAGAQQLDDSNCIADCPVTTADDVTSRVQQAAAAAAAETDGFVATPAPKRQCRRSPEGLAGSADVEGGSGLRDAAAAATPPSVLAAAVGGGGGGAAAAQQSSQQLNVTAVAAMTKQMSHVDPGQAAAVGAAGPGAGQITTAAAAAAAAAQAPGMSLRPVFDLVDFHSDSDSEDDDWPTPVVTAPVITAPVRREMDHSARLFDSDHDKAGQPAAAAAVGTPQSAPEAEAAAAAVKSEPVDLISDSDSEEDKGQAAAAAAVVNSEPTCISSDSDNDDQHTAADPPPAAAAAAGLAGGSSCPTCTAAAGAGAGCELPDYLSVSSAIDGLRQLMEVLKSPSADLARLRAIMGILEDLSAGDQRLEMFRTRYNFVRSWVTRHNLAEVRRELISLLAKDWCKVATA